jgi:tetratricopeptide (TPR) repeat protein
MAQGREGKKDKAARPASSSGGRAGKDAESISVADDTSQDITVLTDKAIAANSPLALALREVESTPDDLTAWDRLESAAAADGRPGIALGAYRRILESDVSAATGMALGRRAANYQAEWLADRPDDLEEILERVLRIDPRCDWALRQLIVSMTLAQRWDALLAVYDRALGSGPDRERRVALLSEAAQVAKDFVGRQELAITYLQELFTLVPGDPQVSTVLERLLERHERWSELVAFWRARLPVVPQAEGRALRERIALAELERLHDPAAALVSLRALLGDKGDHERVLAALEAILALDTATTEVRLGAGTALEGAYDAAGEPARALAAVEKGLKFAGGASRKALLWNAAARRVASGDARTAVNLLAALMPLDPDDREVEDWFRRLCREQKLPSQLIDGLAAAAAATNDGRRRAVLRAEIATVTDVELGDRTAAIAAYQRAWRETETDPVTQRRTLIRLDELLEAADRQAERLPVLAGLADLAPRPGERRAALGTRARLATTLGEVSTAVSAWRACLELDRQDAEALATLPRVLAGAGRWGEYVEILRHRISVAGDPRAEAADLARVAVTERDALGDRPSAITSFQDHERRFGPSVEATDALADLLTDEKRWPDLHALLAETCRRDRARAATLAARLGDACRLRLARPDQAVDWYESALIADPRSLSARDGLEALVPIAAVRPRAVSALLAASGETDDWALRLSLLDARLSDAPAGRARAAILREAATLCEQRAHNKATALAHAARALTADPDDRVSEELLVRLATETGGFRVAVHALEEAAGTTPGLAPRRATELLTRAGAVHEEHLGDPAAALNDYAQALAAEPGRQDLRLAVVRCAGRSARWEPLADALLSLDATPALRDETLFPLAEEAARANAAFVPLAAALGEIASSRPGLSAAALLSIDSRIADWHEKERGDYPAAEAALMRALGHCPDDLPTLHRLVGIQRHSPAPSLYETLRRIAALAPDDLDALYEANEWARDLALPDDVGLEAARTLLDRAARASAAATAGTTTPASAGARRSAADAVALAVDEIARRLCVAGGAAQIRAAYDTYLRAAGLSATAGELARRFRTRAEELAIGRLDDRPAAIRALAQLCAADPADAAAIERLAALYGAEGRFAELAELRRAQLERAQSREQRLGLRLELERVGASIEGASDRVSLLMANLEEAAGHVPTVDALTNVLGSSHRNGQLADVLGVEAEKVENQGERPAAAALWSRLGRVAESALADRPRAIAAHERAAQLVTAVPTLDALGRLCMESAQAEAATRWLDQLLEIAPASDRPAVALRLAQAYLAIDRRHRAIACLERALIEAPTAQSVRAALIDLHRRAGASAPLAALLNEASTYSEDGPTLLAIAHEVYALATGPLGDPAVAVTALERAHRFASPKDQSVPSVVLALATALLAATRTDQAGTVLEKALPGARRSSERAQILFLLGRVRRAQNRHRDAVTVLEQAAAIDLGNTLVLQELFAAAGAAEDNERAERAGRALLALARGGNAQRVGFSVVDVLLRLRDLASARGDEAQAGELMDSAMMEAVRDPSEFRGLCARLRDENQLPALAVVLEKRIAAATSADEQAEAHSEIAELREKLGQPEGALESALQALELRADDVTVRRSTRALAARLGVAEEALTRVESIIDRRRRRGDGPLVARLLLWAGELCDEELADAPRALGFCRRAADTGEVPSEATMAVARIALRCDPAERATAMDRLERFVRDEVTAAGRAEALFRLAEVELQDPQTRARALSSLLAAVEQSPNMERALALVQGASVTDEELASVLPLYERAARQTGNDRQLLDALTRRAQTAAATPAAIREGYDLATALHDDARADALLTALIGFGGASSHESRAGTEKDASAGSQSTDAVWGLIELGKRRRARGDLEGAHGYFAQALEHTDPERVEPHLRQLAEEVREREGDSALAARIYETLRARVPGNAGLWNDLFDLYSRIDDLTSCDRLARERLDQLLEPEARTEIRMRVVRLRLAKDPADPTALESLRDTLLDDPCYLEAGKLLARHYESAGDMEALVDLRESQLKALEDKHDQIHVGLIGASLARALVSAGMIDRALDAFRRALAVSSGNKPLLEEIFACLRDATGGHAPLDNPTSAAAIALARAALQAAGDDRRARTQAAELLAKLLADQQEYATAIQLLLDTMAFAAPGDREQLSSTIAQLRVLAEPAPAPDPEGVVLEDLQEITDHG